MINHPDGSEEQGNGDLSVALDTLGAGDGTMPEVGDSVDVQVSGTVSRIDESNNCAYVTPEMCNGEPPPDMGDSEDDDASLKATAAAADDEDSNSGY